MRKIKNKKNSREGRWQVAVWNKGGGRGIEANGMAIARGARLHASTHRYMRVKRSYFGKTACQSTPSGARQEGVVRPEL